MFRIRIAETSVEVDNRYTYVETQCAGYLTSDPPSFRVRVSAGETEAYRRSLPFRMSDAEAESALLYRRICGEMPRLGAYLLHAALVAVNGRGYAFSAGRGVGKTTHAALWKTRSGHRATVINGDKPLVRLAEDGTYWAYGTPWGGKEGENLNARVPLSAICFLERGETNRIVRADPTDAAARLLSATLLPPDPVCRDQMARLIGATARDVPAFLLACRPDAEAFEIAYETLSTA